MTRMIFVNLPVRDLGPSGAFYRALGGTVNGLFSDEQATCVMFSDTIGVMLLTHERYSQFTNRPIGDARTQSQALLALSVETREDVSTQPSPLRLRRAARPIPIRSRISASCMAAPPRTRTAMSGRSCGWIRPQRKAAHPPADGRGARAALMGGEFPRCG